MYVCPAGRLPWMAPPKTYRNMTTKITGCTVANTRSSGLRRMFRRFRHTMASESPTTNRRSGRASRRAVVVGDASAALTALTRSPRSRSAAAPRFDGSVAIAVTVHRRVPSEREEHVVERGLAQQEAGRFQPGVVEDPHGLEHRSRTMVAAHVEVEE